MNNSKLFDAIYSIYVNFCNWQDKNNIEDNYPEIQEVEDFIKAEQLTIFELDDTEYMEDKFQIWNDTLLENR